MLTKETDVALAYTEKYGLCVVNNCHYERPITNEEQKDIDPYARFVNAKTLADVLLSAEYFGLLFPYSDPQVKLKDYLDLSIKPQKPKKLKIKRRFFPDYSRTSYEKEIRDVVDIWGFDESKYSSHDKVIARESELVMNLPIVSFAEYPNGEPMRVDLPSATSENGWLYFTPVEDWFQSAHDLKMACIYLSSCLNPEFTKYKNEEIAPIFNGHSHEFKQYIDDLMDHPSNHDFAQQFLQWDEVIREGLKATMSELGLYAASAFNIMTSGYCKKFVPSVRSDNKSEYDFELKDYCPDTLSKIWQHFAELCNKKWIGRCAECGNVMISKRKGARITCSDACKTKRSKEGKGDPARKPRTSIGKAKDKSNERR